MSSLEDVWNGVFGGGRKPKLCSATPNPLYPELNSGVNASFLFDIIIEKDFFYPFRTYRPLGQVSSRAFPQYCHLLRDGCTVDDQILIRCDFLPWGLSRRTRAST